MRFASLNLYYRFLLLVLIVFDNGEDYAIGSVCVSVCFYMNGIAENSCGLISKFFGWVKEDSVGVRF